MAALCMQAGLLSGRSWVRVPPGTPNWSSEGAVADWEAPWSTSQQRGLEAGELETCVDAPAIGWVCDNPRMRSLSGGSSDVVDPGGGPRFARDALSRLGSDPSIARRTRAPVNLRPDQLEGISGGHRSSVRDSTTRSAGSSRPSV